MKKFASKKILGLIIFSCLILGILSIGLANRTLAADIIEFTPQIPIPGTSGLSGPTPVGQEVDGKIQSDLLARYIRAFYDYGFAVAGILAAVMLMTGGTLWLVSGGSQTQISQAKSIITGSIIGLVLLFSAWIILNTINPELLKLRSISITGVEQVNTTNEERFGCCECKISIPPIKSDQMCISNVGYTAEECAEFCKTTGQVIYDSIDSLTPGFSLLVLKYDDTHKWDYKCGTEEDNKNTCIEYKSNQYLIFSSTFNSAGWSFDPGIEKQIVDMSPELASFLNCMRSKLPSGVAKISSISDSNYVGNLSVCNRMNCKQPPPMKQCVHSCASCHYGGGTANNVSYAVDFGDQQNGQIIKEAAKECDFNSYVLPEGDHIHVSVSKCPRN